MSAPLQRGLAGRIACAFVASRLTLLAVLAAVGLGALAILLTPREEEPQIVVPMVDISIDYPGAESQQVETELVTPLERQLWGIPGLEYLYSTSMPDRALLTLRFKVGEPLEGSLVKVHQELLSHPELIPSGASTPTVQLLTIDDVPFLTLTLHGANSTPGQLRALADELAREVAAVPDTAHVQVLGGARRQLRIEPDLARLRAAGLGPLDLARAIERDRARLPAGALVAGSEQRVLKADAAYESAGDLAATVIARRGDRAILLRDLAAIEDRRDPEPPVVLYGSRRSGALDPAVTVTIAKRIGTNATELANRVLDKVQRLEGRLLPRDVALSVTRNYGETADEKSNELMRHLALATASVIALIALAMGWRSALVVGIAVPVTLSLTLAITYLLGYTLNRVTLFALIFSIGILVDDAIVVVENIHRHLHLPRNGRSLREVVIEAVGEVGNPTILATFAVIAAILPLAFVRGLMGPYMRPIPVGASLAMLFSLAIAFAVSPWAALKFFGATSAETSAAREGFGTRLYRRAVRAMLRRPVARWSFFAGLTALLVGAFALVGLGAVKVKMLPFDNKSEFQLQLDLPDGSSQQAALALGSRLARELLQEQTVSDLQLYSGVPAPFPFVGLVRHDFLRRGAAQISMQVNLVGKHDRALQSHALITALRPKLQALLPADGTRLKLVEIPPGPPVLDTLVAEVYGPDDRSRRRYAEQVLHAMRTTPGVVDIDSSLEPTGPERRYRVDRERAARHGVLAAEVVQTLSLLGRGQELGQRTVDRGSGAVPIVMQAATRDRSDDSALLGATVAGQNGPIPIQELIGVEERRRSAPVHHKNLLPLSYLFGDIAKQIESPVYALNALNHKLDEGLEKGASPVERFGLGMPLSTEHVALKWDGEWHVTLEVFRDMGLAFAVVMLLIYILVVAWFESFLIPWVILAPVPLSLIGILPAHGLAGAFFTATSMIGFIAGAGIIVRNSIILVDFIGVLRGLGMPLEQAVEEAGVVRFRPMVLTAGAVLVGSAVMLADPIFQGLAISLMAGEVAATLLSRLAVPVVYFLVMRRSGS